MRFLSFLLAFTLTSFLSACGGGGSSSAGLPSGTVVKLTTTAPVKPAVLTLAVGSTQSFNIIGGRYPYQISSSNTQTVVGSVNESSFTVGAVSSGQSTITITDSVNQFVEVAVVVENLTAFYTTAPAALKMTPGSATREYLIGGGQAPYTVVSDNLDVATVTGSFGSVLKITPNKTGAASISVSDSATPTKSTVIINVTVESLVPLSVSPTSASSFVDMPVTVFLNGGTPPYQIGGYIPEAVRVVQDSIDQTKFLVTPLLASEELDISFIDSQGVTVKTTIEGLVGTPTFRVSPSAVSVSALDDQNIILSVFGATLPITAFSSDVAAMQASVEGSVITVSTGTSGSRCVVDNGESVDITVVDAKGSSGTSKITIFDIASSCTLTVAPAAVSLSSTATSATATIIGGVGPYTAISSNTGVATVVISGSDITITRVGTTAASATITVIDNSGKTASIAVSNAANP